MPKDLERLSVLSSLETGIRKRSTLALSDYLLFDSNLSRNCHFGMLFLIKFRNKFIVFTDEDIVIRSPPRSWLLLVTSMGKT